MQLCAWPSFRIKPNVACKTPFATAMELSGRFVPLISSRCHRLLCRLTSQRADNFDEYPWPTKTAITGGSLKVKLYMSYKVRPIAESSRCHLRFDYRFFFAQAPTRSSAFSMFSIEFAP